MKTTPNRSQRETTSKTAKYQAPQVRPQPLRPLSKSEKSQTARAALQLTLTAEETELLERALKEHNRNQPQLNTSEDYAKWALMRGCRQTIMGFEQLQSMRGIVVKSQAMLSLLASRNQVDASRAGEENNPEVAGTSLLAGEVSSQLETAMNALEDYIFA
jgi:hypothetical protein